MEDYTPKQFLKQLVMGIKEEKEHTDDLIERAQIALDHLKEDKLYYSKIKKVLKENMKNNSVEVEYLGTTYWVNADDLNDREIKKVWGFEDPKMTTIVKTSRGHLMFDKRDLNGKLKKF